LKQEHNLAVVERTQRKRPNGITRGAFIPEK